MSEKHLQLGTNPADDNRTMLEDPDRIDALWDDATTVEQFKADIEELASGS